MPMINEADYERAPRAGLVAGDVIRERGADLVLVTVWRSDCHASGTHGAGCTRAGTRWSAWAQAADDAARERVGEQPIPLSVCLPWEDERPERRAFRRRTRPARMVPLGQGREG